MSVFGTYPVFVNTVFLPVSMSAIGVELAALQSVLGVLSVPQTLVVKAAAAHSTS